MSLEEKFEEYLYGKPNCKDGNCKIDNNNIKIVFKPDKGLKKYINLSSDNKCDCIVICLDNKVRIIEILCGVLRSSEFKAKYLQIENCLRIIKHVDKDSLKDCKIYLLIEKYVSSKKEPHIKKLVTTKRVMGKPIVVLEKDRSNLKIC